MTKKINKGLLILTCLFSLLSGVCAGFIFKYYQDLPVSDKLVSGDLKIHFLELGNNNSGDCILIQIGNIDILVDAGSKTSSLETIKSYLNEYVSDNTLEYVIVTHAHEDHYANFAGTGNESTSIFYYYDVNNIIQFAKTNQSEYNSSGNKTMYGNYLTMVNKEVDNGAKLCTALESYNNENDCQRAIELSSTTTLEILNNYYYQNDSSSENNYSVCFIINQGDNHFLFTGDLESDGEEKLVELNNLPEVVLYKAGHHGSKTSSSDALLSIIKPQIVVITCVAGSVEYTQNADNIFPTTTALETIAKYTDKVYVTSQGKITYNSEKDKYEDSGYSSLNGNIIINSNSKGVTITGSNNSTILKDSDWYTQIYSDTGYRKDCDKPW